MKNVQNNLWGSNSTQFETKTDHDDDITTLQNQIDAMSFSSQTITGTFLKDGFGGVDDKVFTYSLFKVGTLVTLVMQREFITFNNARYYVSVLAIPAEYRPASKSCAVFSSIIGPTDSDLDADIMSCVFVHTTGFILIYKEPNPGTGVFNGANQGWNTFSLSWAIVG